MMMNKPFWGQRGVERYLGSQEPTEDLCIVHVPAHKTAPGTQEADALAKIHALATDPLVDTADWVSWKSGPGSAQIGWCIAKEAGLPLTYSDLVNAVIFFH